MRTHALALTILLVALGAAQQRVSGDEAVRIADRFLLSLGQTELAQDVRSTKPALQSAGTTFERWTFWEVEHGNALPLLSVTTRGRVRSFSDRHVSEAIDAREGQPAVPREKRAVRSEEQAWRLAEDVLQRAGYADMGFQRRQLRDLSDGTASGISRWNGADTYSLEFETIEPRYGGQLNYATVTLDAVTGRVVAFRATDYIWFDPPSSVMSLDAALARLRNLFATERARLRAEGKRGAMYEWPGD